MTTKDVTRLFIEQWDPIRGLSNTMVSNNDAKFTFQIFKASFDKFGTILNFPVFFIHARMPYEDLN